MHTLDLRQRLAAVLGEEERDVVDWTIVDHMLHRLYEDLKGCEYPHFVSHFIADSDIRAKDAVYGDHQRLEIRSFVDTGEFEESKEGSRLGCWALAAAFGGLAIWLC